MAKTLTYELVGFNRATKDNGEAFYQCCFIAEKEGFEGIYVEKGTVAPDKITSISGNDDIGLNRKCKIFWEKNSYRIEELMFLD